jgi:hypothetical protein
LVAERVLLPLGVIPSAQLAEPFRPFRIWN